MAINGKWHFCLYLVWNAFHYVLSIACGVIIWKVKEPKTSKIKFEVKIIKKLLGKKRYWNAYFFSLCSHLPKNIVTMMFALFLLTKTGFIFEETSGLALLLNWNFFGLVLFVQLIAAGGVVISSFIIGKLMERANGKKLFVITTVLSIILGIFINVFTQDLISGYIVVFLLGFSSGATDTIAMTYSARITQENPASTSTHFSIFTSFMNAGATIGLAIFSAALPVFISIMPTTVEAYGLVFIISPLTGALALFFLKGLPKNRKTTG
ncbi:MAG: MFS transporter [Candidatus Hodarchaeota archaeon]